MASDSESNNDQENIIITNKLCIKKELTYSLNNKILYKECVKNITRYTLNPGTKAFISDPLLFNLQLSSVQKERELKRRENLIKPAFNCTSLTLEKWAKKIATKIQSNFKNNINKIYHPLDKDNHIKSIVKVVDCGQIPRDSYQNLAATTKYHLALGIVTAIRIELGI
ncbi:hypothetical protein Glove_103g118 [Diversispora epigaea]|uniref:Uncharacterized protein n=1 Tax=Diversispora epigaea TaxID=1348612 RepID=A0A397J3M0_9GLOM|nr:hypothetical protein Glove_103g118 [Diversispora epigaea]